MKIAIGCDHAGVDCKNELVKYLVNQGFEVKDFGTNTTESCDYPDIAFPVAKAVCFNECDRGILICGTGVGIGICANKVNGIRCALCNDAFVAELSRKHNNANMISLGARVIDVEKMKQIVSVFLSTQFEGGRHQKRVDKITLIENSQKIRN